MYHDLLFALNGITGDIFKEKYQEKSYNLIVVAQGLDFIDSAEESILNKEILPLASHVLYLKRFIDVDDDNDQKTESRPKSYYLLVLRNAVELILDHYNTSLIELENTLLADPSRASLPKVNGTLLPWYMPISTLALTLYNYEHSAQFGKKNQQKKLAYSSNIIDEFNTIADTSGNYHSQRWFKFLANKCTSVLINQTKELIFKSELVDPYGDYFIKDLINFEIDWRKVPDTVLSRKSAKDIVFIARTNQVVKDNKLRHNYIPNRDHSDTDLDGTFDDSDDPTVTSIFHSEEHKNYKFIPLTIENDLEKLKEKANEELIKFIGRDKILKFLNIIKQLFLLNDSSSWKEFLNKMHQINPIMASKKFADASNYIYEDYDVNLNYVLPDTTENSFDVTLGVGLPKQGLQGLPEKNLDQTFVGDDEHHYNETSKKLCDVYGIIEASGPNGSDKEVKYSSKLTTNLSRLHLSIKVPYPINLVFDEWSMERYNYFWRLLLRLSKTEYDLEQLYTSLKVKSTRLTEILFIIRNFRAYLFDDVISSLLDEFFTENKMFNKDFEVVVNSHRQFLLRAMQQSFLQSKTVFSLISRMILTIENYVKKTEILFKSSPSMTTNDDIESYQEFEKLLAVLFNLLKKQSNFNQTKNNEGRFLEMLLLRLDYNRYFSRQLEKRKGKS